MKNFDDVTATDARARAISLLLYNDTPGKATAVNQGIHKPSAATGGHLNCVKFPFTPYFTFFGVANSPCPFLPSPEDSWGKTNEQRERNEKFHISHVLFMSASCRHKSSIHVE
ncbi:hypothetical protein AVEN_104681-1 [Araneus ventricosus]|uniref:Uncharacterized protein n=1 Tax=Araneus ventricosus TaxID=182803 RepID=A0A4Y2BCK0_ARAVE|nr:hypothetical protein AVEN_104681-1 [Araneus ventricosus]